MKNLLQELREEAQDRTQLARRFGLRAAIILLLLAALIVPSCQLRGGDEQLAVVIDVSNSVALSAIGQVVTELEGADSAKLLAFADRPVQAADADGLRSLELLDRSASGARRATAGPNAIYRDHTDIERALRSALDLVPTDGSGRVLLLSDGNRTRGAELGAAEAARNRRVRIDTLPLQTAFREPRIVGVEMPTDTTANAAQQALVKIAAVAPATFLLEIRVGDREAETQVVEHPGAAGEGATATDGALAVPIQITFPEAGDVPLALRILPAGENGAPTGDPSRWRSTVRVKPEPEILLVEGRDSTPLYFALTQRGLNLRRTSESNLPSDANQLREYRAILLHDVDANELGAGRMNALSDWVRGGGSLVFASGESSYGEGGYNDTAIADILPVTFEVREEKAEVALMISLDKSYSMKGDKMDLAKEATKAALGELEDEHLFGLVAFDWNTFNIVPLQLASNREDIREQISKIEASAQTNFYPALESCFQQLSAIEDPTGKVVKHVILVSDGKTYPDDYEGLVRRMYDADITLSTVAVGLESDVELLQQIAEWGHGRSYFVQDAARVQKILLDEARSKLEDTLIEEDTKVMATGSHPVLVGIDVEAAPPLLGFVSYRAKPGSEVLLQTDEEQPILARRRFGAGESWVLATDLTDRWSAPWLRWDGFVPMISQLLHYSAQGAFNNQQHFTVERRGSHVDLVARLHEPSGEKIGAPINGADVQVRIGGASAERRIALPQVSPGLYRTSVEVDPNPSGDIRFELLLGGQSLALRSIYFPGTDEIEPRPTNALRLAALATTTDGTAWQANALSQALVPRPQEVRRTVPLWRWFLAAAALLYLVELVLHRLGKLDRPFANT